ncbi:hypothetical protein [Pseudoalteromonas tetraodonis]|uniref:hypothetical protein n=1 Tax=Pseudoalteromonas tetraodonis TaxID=43659 RepID=UPI003A972329
MNIFKRIYRYFFPNPENHFSELTDEEKQLVTMNSFQLVAIINKARATNLQYDTDRALIAEMLLAQRLVKLQTKPAYLALVIGLLSIIASVLIAFFN